VEAEYRTGVILSDGSPEIHHTKIKIIAEVISDDFGPPIISYQDVIVDYDEFRSPQFEESLDPEVVNITLQMNSRPEAGVVSYRAIRGSAVYTIKEFTITNPHSQPINHLSFFIKQDLNSLASSNSSGVDLGHQLLNNSCNNIDLARVPLVNLKFVLRLGALSRS
jgi:hypothetical protein